MCETKPCILIMTNSQGSSLGLTEGCNWPVLFARSVQQEFDVRSICISGWTIREVLANLRDNVTVHSPDLVIFQLGIVEAPQRILSEREKGLIRLMPFSRRITAFLHKKRATVLRWRARFGVPVRAVAPDEFTHLLGTLIKRLATAGIDSRFLTIPSFPDGGQAMNHPFINGDIALYNSILTRFACISIGAGWQAEMYQAGTVHFNPEGHLAIVGAVLPEVRRMLANKI